MSKDTSTTAEITDEEYQALADLNLPTEEARTEYAVVYYRVGKLVAEGPFEERRLAEVRQRTKGGVIAERQVITDFGLWTESPEIDAMADFASARVKETPDPQGAALYALLVEHIMPFVSSQPGDSPPHRNANMALRRFVEQWQTHPDFPFTRPR